MPSSPDPQSWLSALDPDTAVSLARRVRTALADMLELVTSGSPMFEMHRNAPPPLEPRSGDEALELLRASAYVRATLADQILGHQSTWALNAALYGASQADIADALQIDRSTVAKRWPGLGKLRQEKLWFRAPDNARRWAMTCMRLEEVAGQLRFMPLPDYGNVSAASIVYAAKLARAYLDSCGEDDEASALSETWLDMVLNTHSTIEYVIEPRRVQPSTDAAAAMLEEVRLVWRAYRAGVSVEDLVERDEQARSRRAGAETIVED